MENSKPSIFDDLTSINSAEGLAANGESEASDSGAVSDAEVSPDMETAFTIEVMPQMRDSLVFLLKKGLVELEKNQSIYKTVKQYQTNIRDFLAAIYIELVIDDLNGLIFTRSVTRTDDDGNETLVWARGREETYHQSLVYLVIRRHFHDREMAGETQIFIDAEYISAELQKYWNESASGTKDQKKIENCINRAVEDNILIKPKANEGERYRISPMVKHQLDMDYLQSTLASYQESIDIEIEDELVGEQS
ncbi:DUF4194 domain-containing protein [Neptuniibacter marinus]|uniref:DUF4194 domain-containing protein n=1 Tax=Neptuniibacter marinus TaxID=1806670 RepID=UPI003B5B1397